MKQIYLTKNHLSLAQQKCDEALYAIKTHSQTSFWKQCVRYTDENSELKQISLKNNKSRYGGKQLYGLQPTIDYTNQKEVNYLEVSVATRKLFYKNLLNVSRMNLTEFTSWLDTLHASMRYRTIDSKLQRRLVTPRHSQIVKVAVMPVAEQYGDLYDFRKGGGPIFPNIDSESLPRDELKNGQILHYYPDPLKYSEFYLQEAQAIIKYLLSLSSYEERQYIYKVAEFLQILINLHQFPTINFSLYMNMANALLELVNVSGISHGIIDYVALRLQPEIFKKYFHDQVKSSN